MDPCHPDYPVVHYILADPCLLHNREVLEFPLHLDSRACPVDLVVHQLHDSLLHLNYLSFPKILATQGDRRIHLVIPENPVGLDDQLQIVLLALDSLALQLRLGSLDSRAHPVNLVVHRLRDTPLHPNYLSFLKIPAAQEGHRIRPAIPGNPVGLDDQFQIVLLALGNPVPQFRLDNLDSRACPVDQLHPGIQRIHERLAVHHLQDIRLFPACQMRHLRLNNLVVLLTLVYLAIREHELSIPQAAAYIVL